MRPYNLHYHALPYVTGTYSTGTSQEGGQTPPVGVDLGVAEGPGVVGPWSEPIEAPGSPTFSGTPGTGPLSGRR